MVNTGVVSKFSSDILPNFIFYNINSSVYYNFVHGDKDTFKFAFQYLNRNSPYYQINYHTDPSLVPYGFMPYGPFHKGIPNPWGKYGGGSVMVQRDRSGAELFNHRNINKFAWKGENPYNSDVTNEPAYHMIMNHIRVKYGVA